MNVLVTGASGFVGGWVSRALQARGEHVRALYRRRDMPYHLMRLSSLGAEVLRHDLTRDGDAAAATRGMDAVVHAAALTIDWGSEDLFRRQNYALTVRLVEAARGSGCRVFLYLGSIAVHGFGRHVDSNEEGPYYPHVNPYQVTKKAAEEYVLSRCQPGFRTTSVRPGIVYGPGDTTTLYPLLDALRLGVKGTLGGGRSLTCPVYIDDLVDAVVLALDRDASAGQVFNVTGGERVCWAEFLGYAAELLGVRPWASLPIPVARLLAPLLSGVFGLFRVSRPPPLTRYRVEQLAHDFHFSIEKARRVLGYEPRVGWREGLRRAVEAYRVVDTAARQGRRRRHGTPPERERGASRGSAGEGTCGTGTSMTSTTST